MTMYAVTTFANGRTSFRAIDSADDLLPGEVGADSVPDHSLADYVVGATAAIQSWLDRTAAQNNYDSLASCISYAASAVVQYKADATAAIAWRDAVWQACYQMQTAQAANPPNPLPTFDELIAQLPQPETFGWVIHSPGA